MRARSALELDAAYINFTKLYKNQNAGNVKQWISP
jgi:hypothetical protein